MWTSRALRGWWRALGRRMMVVVEVKEAYTSVRIGEKKKKDTADFGDDDSEPTVNETWGST
jgi:hypothetical protein